MSDLVFGKYELGRKLASGGMGEVFLARQPDLGGREVILKSLLPELADKPDFVAQFLDEARVVAALNHPNVVSVFDVGVWQGTYYLAMEYVDGITLSQLQRQAAERGLRIPPRVAAAIVRDAALGLAHAHGATGPDGRPLGIVHRDVSPQNLMVRRDGVVKVVDFGIALASERQTRTAAGVVKGKFSYMAPEQALGQRVTPAADQFALGVVLWELLAGRRLFKGAVELEVIKRVLDEPIVRPGLVRDDVPPELDTVAMRALQRPVERRFEGCAQLAAALDVITDGRTPTGESPVARFLASLGGATAPAPLAPVVTPRNQVVSLQPGAGLSPAALDALQAPAPDAAKYSTLAALSFVSGLACCGPFSLVAVGTGVMALSGKQLGSLRGLWMARVGVGLGVLGVGANLVALAYLRRWLG